MIIDSSFKPAWWLRNPHGQTVWPYMFKHKEYHPTKRERFELPDGDFIDLDWMMFDEDPIRPIITILHGLGGSIESHYIQRMLRTFHDLGWNAVVMHFRGCSGEPNRLPRSYHSGETGDLALVSRELVKRYPKNPKALLGFSLGGNVLLKWLGEVGDHSPYASAVAVSVPYDLAKVANSIKKGLSKMYLWYLLDKLRKAVYQKQPLLEKHIDFDDFTKAKDFWSFDNAVTAPIHGFQSASDYYRQSSCKPYLKSITTPTLLIHALDDPFMQPDVIPSHSELSEYVALEVSPWGGHVGFISGASPNKPKYWLTERIPEYFEKFFSHPH